ncbi:hypothetical protein DZK27_09925 [Rhodobacteraceae bacterium 63075]|nr:hypothetical protein DZK27_09925 [Rhodobacteraceae bacterium 63075]
MVTSVSFESKCSCFLEIFFSTENTDEEADFSAKASGFFWRYEGDVYLITNRHNVTGRNSQNELIKQCMPTRLWAYFMHLAEDGPEPETFLYKQQALEYTLWENGNPDWQEHPKGAEIDVVAMQLKGLPYDVQCINDKAQYDWSPMAGDDCFIIVYPQGLTAANKTPIWKRASIATEPELPFNNEPLFLCDTATREGMSGAMVVAKIVGNFGKEGRDFDSNNRPQFFGYWTRFLGVYSGRNGDEEDGFQLGRVWHAKLVEEIVSNKSVPEPPWIPRLS